MFVMGAQTWIPDPVLAYIFTETARGIDIDAVILRLRRNLVPAGVQYHTWIK